MLNSGVTEFPGFFDVFVRYWKYVIKIRFLQVREFCVGNDKENVLKQYSAQVINCMGRI